MRTQRGTPNNPVLTLAMIIPALVVLYIAASIPPFWDYGIAGAMLGLAMVAFVLLWQTKPDATRWNRQGILYGCFFSMSLLAIVVVILGLTRANMLRQFGLDVRSALLLSSIVLMVLLIPPLMLLRRKQQRDLQKLMTDEENQVEEEFRQTIRHMPPGWGMRPEEAIKQGRVLFWANVFLGAFGIIGGIAAAIYTTRSGWGQLQSSIFFAFSLLFCFGGVYLLLFGTSQGLKLWRAGRSWREQAAGTITVQGTFADWWTEEEVNNKTLVKIQRKDGSDKMLLVGAELNEQLPEVSEGVQIDYLFGCEAVVEIRSLAGAEGVAPAAEEEDQAAER